MCIFCLILFCDTVVLYDDIPVVYKQLSVIALRVGSSVLYLEGQKFAVGQSKWLSKSKTPRVLDLEGDGTALELRSMVAHMCATP